MIDIIHGERQNIKVIKKRAGKIISIDNTNIKKPQKNFSEVFFNQQILISNF